MAAAPALAPAPALAAAPAPAPASHGGFHLSGTQLLDANGIPFVARGTVLTSR